MQTAIKHNWFYACSPETIWDYLTKPELLSQWVMKNDIQPIVGHRFMFKTNPYPEMEFDGNVYCEILEVVPFKKLSYSWKGGPAAGQTTMDSVVTWMLKSKDNGTELFLEHTGFGELVNKKLFEGMNGGWKQNMGKMEQLIIKQQANETADR